MLVEMFPQPLTVRELIKELLRGSVNPDFSVLIRTEKEGFYEIDYVNHADDSIILEAKHETEWKEVLDESQTVD